MTVSAASASVASWRISTLPSSEIVLRSQRCQRLSSAVTTATPRSTCSRVGVGSGLLIMNTVGATSFGNEWSRFATPRVTCRYTRLVGERLPRDQLADEPLPIASSVCGLASRMPSRLRCSRARCCGRRNGCAVVDRHQLVHAVAVDEAAVEHGDLRVARSRSELRRSDRRSARCRSCRVHPVR